MRKYLLVIFGIIYLFFFGVFDVNAATYSGPINYSPSPRIFDLNGTSSALVPVYNDNGTDWIIYAGAGEGTLVFSLYYYCNAQPCHPLTEVAVQDNNGNQFACEFDSPMWYVDNDKQYEVITPSCNVNFTTYGLKYVVLRRAGTAGRILGRLGVNSTFITTGTNVNVQVSQQEVVDAITSSNQNIRNEIINQGTTMNNIQNDTSDIKNAITDSNIDTNSSSSATSGFSSSTNSGMSNTPVSGLITLPITFLTGVSNAISSSCTNINYIELFNYQLVLPCLNLSQRLGNVWTIIDTIFSCMLIFSIGKSLVRTFARLSDMDTNIMYECYANGKSHRGDGD